MSFLKQIFGDPNEKILNEARKIVAKINALEKELEQLPDEKIKAKTSEFKDRLGKGEKLDNLLPEAFAVVREASKRTLKQRHFDVQLIGGIVLHRGQIAEMKTGEGKTLVATLPLYLNALGGKGCHLVTVNDYLARRDTVWMGQIFNFLGLSVACLNHERSYVYSPEYKKPTEEKDTIRDELGNFYVVEDFLKPCSRKEAYSSDIIYGTNTEFGFDYLRDNLVYEFKDMVQRDLNYAIIDEVDSILIDEARTPLIISGVDAESSQWYQDFSVIIPQLEASDYEIDEKLKAVSLKNKGIEKIEKILGVENIYEEKGIRYVHHLEQALKAQFIFKRDKDYIVKNGEVIIVDEFTGRIMPGRRWSGGLHQAIEAKEKVEVKPESITLASITLQNYFRMYKKLAGMTGTALTSAEEFAKVYNLEVIAIPTNKPMIRNDLPDKIFKTKEAKFRAIVKEIKKRYSAGQPVLVGTTSIENNEYLGKLLSMEGVKHEILNAKHHEQEGQIIAQAGKLKTVTVATNMAGRGVDIILGGNPIDEENAKKVKELGGLFVLGTERHEARRIDNQLRGRAGRQGDPGSSQFFLSLEDDLVRIFNGERIKNLMTTLNLPEDEAIESRFVSKAIEEAQKKVEAENFDARKHLLEYDDVMNKHRTLIYKKRKEIIERNQTGKIKELLLEMFIRRGYQPKDYEEKEKELGEEIMRRVERFLPLKILDDIWANHLENMEYLRDSVRLRAYGQLDPLVEYKKEGHRMFEKLIDFYETSLVNAFLNLKIRKEMPSQPVVVQNPISKKIGRNDPCPCGAKKPDGTPIKYKHCCGKIK